jgi:hypothetical protein
MSKRSKAKLPTSGSYSRPQFFFGKLLTDEDLRDEQRYFRNVCGVTRGIVTDNIDPSGASRVKVQLPSLGAEQVWAVVLRGAGVPHSASPQPGDEVAVMFEDSDANRPIVLGILSGS